jgi:hypothetical protein
MASMECNMREKKADVLSYCQRQSLTFITFHTEPIEGGWTKRSYEFLAARTVPLG